MLSRIKYFLSLVFLFLVFTTPALAGEPKPEPVFNNPLAVVLIILMVFLLIVIAILASVLLGVAANKSKEREKRTGQKVAVITGLLLLVSPFAIAQQDEAKVTVQAATSFGGLTPSAFYLMIIAIFFELLVILVLLFNIRVLIRKEKQREAAEPGLEVSPEVSKNRVSWWDKFNKLRPVSQEAELDLGHEYDGIRELNNRLPPWWLYGFYATIIFAVIYLWRFHVSHAGPSSQEEYEHSIISANKRVEEYLKKKGESVDENTVVLLTGADDLSAGQAIFADPAKCATCHSADGGGTIGPNLTDDYWLYGGSVKDIFKIIKYGTNKGMKSWKDDLSPKQIAQVTSYIRTLRGTKPASPKIPQGELYREDSLAAAPVDTTKRPGDRNP